jgi:hypothetical protein
MTLAVMHEDGLRVEGVTLTGIAARKLRNCSPSNPLYLE